MRQQYHARRVGADLYVWDVHHLARLAKDMIPFNLPLDDLSELDELWWYADTEERPTPRSIAEHIVLMHQVDMSHPIILCADSRLMDGMHRALRALVEKRPLVTAVQFAATPEPDFVNVSLDDLPYPEDRAL
ncbi:MAG: hypothetical protein AAGA06_11805 [Pseudomonadota bacterium]